ncbi:flavin reductase family protein [Propionivibrio dicarboxylicus]|uniref:NADH-FMN oxidoreductase RutF, flavin reductase (DIM6/NTAB) family n=1 Tax=Propionivibrio dicarboxylicus TaxID=83767 RepID=A0A1G8LTK5_9RHOO|nr:flavin reductase family protein [Propionivibrio dicarboxylicus]SDI58965.1 NADH-FMN oxidoreductase RutF, flavin reductase (DIM6/NTAB) family [Propionivibrio dicarboxylicus]
MQNGVHPVPLEKSYLLLNHGPVTLVGSAHAGRSNVMAASWVMPLDFDPPKVVLVIDRNTLTRDLIEASGEFSLSIPCRSMASQVLAAGSLSGRDGEKAPRCGLEFFAASRVAAPLVRGCVAWLECRVIPYRDNQDRHDLFVAEVVSAHADAAVFSQGRWHFSDDRQRTLHYQAGGAFFVTGESFDASEQALAGG